MCLCVHTCSWMHQLQPQRLLTHPRHLATAGGGQTNKKCSYFTIIANCKIKKTTTVLRFVGNSRPPSRQLLNGAAVVEGEFRLCHRHVGEAQRQSHDHKLCNQARSKHQGCFFSLASINLTRHTSRYPNLCIFLVKIFWTRLLMHEDKYKFIHSVDAFSENRQYKPSSK